MAAVSTSDQLIQLYNQLDAFLRQQYKQDRYADHGFLLQEVAKSNRVVASHLQELRAIAQLRNSLVHNPFAAIASPLATPHPAVVARYKAIHDAILKPHTALSIAVPAGKMYIANLETPLNKVLRQMNDHIFTHVPIIKNDKMIGVFSENSLLSYLAESGEAIITNDMTIADFAAYLPLATHRGEHFAFLPRKATLADVYEVFSKAIKVHQRIGMIFITEHGKEQEKPLGIVTAWDLASPEFELQ